MNITVVSMTLFALAVLGQADRQNSVASDAAKFMGDYFLGKALDQVWDKLTGTPDIRELDLRLRLFEESLKPVDGNLGNAIQDLRRRLDTKVSKEEVRQIVQETLKKLEARVQMLEARV